MTEETSSEDEEIRLSAEIVKWLKEKFEATKDKISETTEDTMETVIDRTIRALALTAEKILQNETLSASNITIGATLGIPKTANLNIDIEFKRGDQIS